MYQILEKRRLSANSVKLVIDAPYVAKKAEPGQFIILRVDEDGERIPLTISEYDREKGTIAIVVQEIGATTMKLCMLNEGDCLHDFVGPLGIAHGLLANLVKLLRGSAVLLRTALPLARFGDRLVTLVCERLDLRHELVDARLCSLRLRLRGLGLVCHMAPSPRRAARVLTPCGVAA